MNTQNLLFSFLIVVNMTSYVFAEETDFGKTKPSANQVIEALSPALDNSADVNNDDITSRSIDLSSLGTTPHANKKIYKKRIEQGIKKAAAETALSMGIFFEYNSAELTNSAKDYLKPVGEAMASEKLQGLEFVVEGHTDAVGSDTYNKELSEERARSVRVYLEESFHIDPSRIHIIGKGKNGLLDRKNPESEVNRRVKIIAKK